MLTHTCTNHQNNQTHKRTKQQITSAISLRSNSSRQRGEVEPVRNTITPFRRPHTAKKVDGHKYKHANNTLNNTCACCKTRSPAGEGAIVVSGRQTAVDASCDRVLRARSRPAQRQRVLNRARSIDEARAGLCPAELHELNESEAEHNAVHDL